MDIDAIKNLNDAANAVQRAYDLYDLEETKKLSGEPCDIVGAQALIDKAAERYEDLACPKSVLALANEVLIARAEARADKLAERVKVLEEALRLAQELDDFHNNCPDCEGEDQPELCATCFPFADKARLARRAALHIGENVVQFPAPAQP